MTKKTYRTICRVILALALIYGVYTETGKWTASFAFLTFIAIEGLNSIVIKLKRGEL